MRTPTSRAIRGRGRPAQGVVLLETLVALAVLGTAMGVLMQIHTAGLRTATLAAERANAVIVAEGVLARAGADLPLEAGTVEGDDAGRGAPLYRWTLVTAPAISPAGRTVEASTPPDAETGPQPVPGLMTLTVQVRWSGADGTPRSMEIKSARAVGER